MSSASSCSSASGSWSRSNTITRLSMRGCRAIGSTGAAHRRLAGKALRDVQHRRHRDHVEQAGRVALVAQAQRVVPQPRLRGLELARQADQRAHVRQRFVRVAFAHAVGLGQVLELERGRAVLALRPPRGRPGAAHAPGAARRAGPSANCRRATRARRHRRNCGTGRSGRTRRRSAASCSRALQVSGRAISSKMQGERGGFAHAVAQRVLRRDAGDHRGAGRGQQVVGRAARRR